MNGDQTLSHIGLQTIDFDQMIDTELPKGLIPANEFVVNEKYSTFFSLLQFMIYCFESEKNKNCTILCVCDINDEYQSLLNKMFPKLNFLFFQPPTPDNQYQSLYLEIFDEDKLSIFEGDDNIFLFSCPFFIKSKDEKIYKEQCHFYLKQQEKWMKILKPLKAFITFYIEYTDFHTKRSNDEFLYFNGTCFYRLYSDVNSSITMMYVDKKISGTSMIKWKYLDYIQLCFYHNINAHKMNHRDNMLEKSLSNYNDIASYYIILDYFCRFKNFHDIYYNPEIISMDKDPLLEGIYRLLDEIKSKGELEIPSDSLLENPIEENNEEPIFIEPEEEDIKPIKKNRVLKKRTLPPVATVSPKKKETISPKKKTIIRKTSLVKKKSSPDVKKTSSPIVTPSSPIKKKIIRKKKPL